MSRMGALWLAAALAAASGCSDAPSVAVGSKNFTEQVILGELVAQLLEARGVEVDRRLNLGGTFICHRALLSGDLDVYVEYTGTALTAILDQEVSHDRHEVFQRVRERYRSDLGLDWSGPLGFENTFVVAMLPDVAERLGIRTLSDLRAHQDQLRPGAGHEFLERQDGFRGLVEAYDLSFRNPPRGMELSLVYQALTGGEVDFVVGNSTDGLIDKFGLAVLEDDLSYFPPYDAAAVYRPETAERIPAFREVLQLLEGSLDEEEMRSLNRQVDDEGRSAAAAVAAFLEAQKSIRPPEK